MSLEKPGFTKGLRFMKLHLQKDKKPHKHRKTNSQDT